MAENNQPIRLSRLLLAVGAIFGAFGGSWLLSYGANPERPAFIQYGTMHEALGQQQHQGRVALGELVDRPHFFGVAALETLAGEVTIHDGTVTITGVDSAGQLEARKLGAGGVQATLLAGAYVDSWTPLAVENSVAPDALDRFVAAAAEGREIDTSRPFVFTIVGDFTDLDFHVINGACPRQARSGGDVPKEQMPFEGDRERVSGTLVGIFAKDAVGELTHPGSSTHVHVLFTDSTVGQTVTAHVDRVGVVAGAILRLPQ